MMIAIKDAYNKISEADEQGDIDGALKLYKAMIEALPEAQSYNNGHFEKAIEYALKHGKYKTATWFVEQNLEFVKQSINIQGENKTIPAIAILKSLLLKAICLFGADKEKEVKKIFDEYLNMFGSEVDCGALFVNSLLSQCIHFFKAKGDAENSERIVRIALIAKTMLEGYSDEYFDKLLELAKTQGVEIQNAGDTSNLDFLAWLEVLEKDCAEEINIAGNANQAGD